MLAGTYSRVEELLLDRVALELAARGQHDVDRFALQKQLQRVLHALRSQTVKDRPTIADGRSARGPVREREQLVEVQLERALAETLSIAFQQAGLGPPNPPCVLVVDAEMVNDPRKLESSLNAALERDGPPPVLPGSPEMKPRGALLAVIGSSAEWLHAKFNGVRMAERATFVDRGQCGAIAAAVVRGVQMTALPESLDVLLQVLDENLRALDASAVPRPTQAASTDTLVGTNLDGKYEILRRIGRGTFGSVYEARDVRLGNRVAIKVLHPDEQSPPEDLVAFKNEARRLTRLSHPHIVDWKAFEETADCVSYLVMELLDGEELEGVLRREGRIEPRRAARILVQIADALRAAHFLPDGESVLHLDLKPGNVFLLPEREGTVERVKVIDFGIGQHIGGVVTPLAASGQADGENRDGTLRAVRTLRRKERHSPAEPDRVQRCAACTPEYAAPEQCAHMLADASIAALDGRADLYSLGAIAFRMVTGRLPFEPPADRFELLQTKCDQDPPSVRSVGVRVPGDLAEWIDRCLARDREHRFRDLREAHEALQRIVSPPLWRRLAVPGALTTTALAVALWALWPAHTSVPTLDVWALVDGAERSLLGAPLYLGPKLPSAELRIVGLTPATDELGPAPSLRLVDDKGERARDLPGWSVAWVGGGKIRVDAALGPERAITSLYVEVARAGSVPLYSIPLEFVWIGGDAWHLVDTDVRDLQGRALDPVGNSLQIRVRGQLEDLAWVGVERGEQRFKATGSETSRDGSDHVLLVPLEDMKLSTGLAAVIVAADDRCGRSEQQRLELDIQSEPLHIQSAELDGVRVADHTVVSSKPMVHLALTGRADVSWAIRNNTGEQIARGQQQAFDRGELLLGDLPNDGEKAISGWVELSANDASYVARTSPAERGRASERLPFSYDPLPLEFDIRVVDPHTSEVRPLSETTPVYSADARVTVRVVRKNVVPARVDVVARPVSEPNTVCAQATSAMADVSRAGQDVRLDFPSDGAFAVELRAYRQFSDGSEDRTVAFSKRGTIVIERQPPVLAVGGLTQPIVIRSMDESPPRTHITVAKRNGAALGFEAPVEVSWDLFRDSLPDTPVAHGMVADTVTSTRPVDVGLPVPWSNEVRSRANELDGKWTARINAVDAAGNSAVPIAVKYEVGLDGPDLELVRPAPATTWPRDSSGRFQVEVRARDPNGVADLTCSLRRRGEDGVRVIALTRTADSSDTTNTTWKGDDSFPPTWSQAEVHIDLAATDGARARSRLLQACMLPTIEIVLPARIAVDVGGQIACPMRRVRGNLDREYVFGGRVDAQEEELFRSAGLGLYNPFATPKSWQAVCAPGEIPDFYLDEREVAASEMLAFVQAADGWDDPHVWPSAEPPAPSRRDELAAHLLALNPEIPATDVTWDEASAYARWAGKRLQSWVEWEYALRGGSRYRPWAGWSEGTSTPHPGDVNSDDRSSTRGPWPGQRGADFTSDTGIAHLSDNVAEWTATVVGAEKRAAAPSALAASPLAPVEDTHDIYWVAGGSFESSTFDFSVADRRRRRWHGPGVGFRCALTATEFARSQGDTSPRVRFRALESHDVTNGYGITQR